MRTMIRNCKPGQNFIVDGLPACRGVLISTTDCGASVDILREGRTVIAPGTLVWAVAGPDSPHPPQHRPKLLGHHPAAVVAWCGAEMWPERAVLHMLAAYDITMPLLTVRLHMERGNEGTGAPVAPLARDQQAELEEFL